MNIVNKNPRYIKRFLPTTRQTKNEKEAVLKVFRSRFSSEKTVLNSRESSPQMKHQENTEPQVVIDSSSPSVSEKDSLSQTKLQAKQSPRRFSRMKRRKSRSERNKMRNKVKLKNESDTREKSDFMKHMKMIKKMTQPVPVNEATTSSSSITQNRLTRRLGLFNQGKASWTIGRGNLILSESGKMEAEEDIRKILNKPAKDPGIFRDSATMDTDHELTRSKAVRDIEMPLKPSRNIHENMQSDIMSVPSSAKSTISMPSTPQGAMFDLDMTRLSQRSRPSSTPCSLPESPALSDIANDLIKGLNVRQLFPGKSLLEETREELQRMLRINSASEMLESNTPDRDTSAANNFTPLGSVSSETVTRGQFDAGVSPGRPHTKCHSAPNSQVFVEEEPSGSHGDTHHRGSTAAYPRHHERLGFVDAASPMRWMTCLSRTSTVPDLNLRMVSPQDQVSLCTGTANLPPRALDTVDARTRPVVMETDFGAPFQLFADKPDGCHMTGCHMPQRAIPERVYPSSYVPSHHGNYTSLHSSYTNIEGGYTSPHHNPRECFHNLFQRPSTQVVEGMDILEYIDQDSQVSVSLQPSPGPRTSRYHDDQSRLPRPMTPDSDETPAWYDTLPPMPKLAPLDSPTSPHLYRRRLY